MPNATASARDGALAKLAAEAARFAAGAGRPEPVPPPAAQTPPAPRAVAVPATSPEASSPAAGPPGYVPVAVAPERGNTRPVVPVDGRIHMRMAQATIDALDEAVAALRATDPARLRDLERATIIRVAVALALTDVAERGARGAVGEAVRAALDPSVRHTDQALPTLTRWLRAAPVSAVDAERSAAGPRADAAPG